MCLWFVVTLMCAVQFLFRQKFRAECVRFVFDCRVVRCHGIASVGTAINDERKHIKLSRDRALPDHMAFTMAREVRIAGLRPHKFATIMAVSLDDAIGVVLVDGPAGVMATTPVPALMRRVLRRRMLTRIVLIGFLLPEFLSARVPDPGRARTLQWQSAQ